MSFWQFPDHASKTASVSEAPFWKGAHPFKLTSKTFNPGTVNAKKAIEDLSFHAAKGDFITVIGANGAGKSTLFNAISGSFFTDSGKIELDGKDITFMPEYKRARSIGRLFQDPMRGSAPGMTIEENLALAAGHVVGSVPSPARTDRRFANASPCSVWGSKTA